MAEQEDKGVVLVQALAEYFEVEPEEIHGFIFACERDHAEGGVTMSSAWSVNTPFWHLLGYLDESRHHVERQHRGIAQQAVTNGTAPSRAARRGSRGRRGQ